MLINLRVRNFAIIESLDLDLASGFTVITGETGAGKSIVVDALSLALGGRGSPKVVRTGCDRAVVEALFDLQDHPRIRAALVDRGLEGDDADVLLVRRVISPKGRGKVLINGHLSTVATLGEVVRGMVDISGQHDQQSLLITDNHLEILDAFGGHKREREAYQEAYEVWREKARALKELEENQEETLRRLDYLRFQLQELDEVDPQEGELEALEEEHARLAHAEKILQGLAAAESAIYGEDASAYDRVGLACTELASIARVEPKVGAVIAALESAHQELQEAARSLQGLGEHLDPDPQRLEEVEDRLAVLHRMVRKHGGSIDDVIRFHQSLSAELQDEGDLDGRLAELREDVAALEASARELAKVLFAKRKKAATKLRKEIERELADLELDGAVFMPELCATELGPKGTEQCEFLWSANPGEEPRPLNRIASGGELSRLMLAVKCVLRQRDLVSLYVFDEVDTGVGGKAADRIGEKIQRVASGHQAIAITHLAPIAARAEHHLQVSKRTEEGRTMSRMQALDGDERLAELARMIDGTTGAKTMAAAKTMVTRASV